METKKPYQLYEEEFKKSIVTLYQNGKSQSQLSKEYGISTSAISKWIKQYSTVKTEDGDVLTAKPPEVAIGGSKNNRLHIVSIVFLAHARCHSYINKRFVIE